MSRYHEFDELPTDDKTPDGTQLPTEEEMDEEEGDAGVGGVEW